MGLEARDATWDKINRGDWNCASSGTLRRHLFEHWGHECQVCGLSEWMDEKITLEIDHKDGNSENNKLENLRLICPNCHAQTDTYKSKNIGSGRYKRMERYHSGRSY